jgi:hypothetical protein
VPPDSPEMKKKDTGKLETSTITIEKYPCARASHTTKARTSHSTGSTERIYNILVEYF